MLISEMLRGVLMLVLCLIAKAAYEEEICHENGVAGKCVSATNCRTPLENIRRRKHPQTCSSFDKADPKVCCSARVLDPIAVTDRFAVEVPSKYYYDINEGKEESECGPVDPQLTSPKTGQKAWDKCVEYQEKLVYPCQKSTALIGGYQRNYKCLHNADELIVGGENATKNEFPHMVLLGYKTDSGISWECGGSLISENFVLTAGHCLRHGFFGDVKYVSLGVLDRRNVKSSNTYEVKRTMRHPQFRIGVYNDIALVELKNQVKLDAFTVPACLHVGDVIDARRAVVTGWGLLDEYGKTPSDVLQKVTVKKIRTVTCERDYPKHNMRMITRSFDNKTQLCYGDRHRKRGTCKGDSGGPLQIKHKKINCMYLVIGVVSGGRGCALRGIPDLYSKVSHHIAWIESVVWP